MNIFSQDQRFRFGEVVYKPGGRFGERLNRNLQMVLVNSGEATITVDGEERPVAAGEAALTRPGCWEYFRFSATTETHHTWVEAVLPTFSPGAARVVERLPFRVSLSPTLHELIRLGLRCPEGAASTDLRHALARAAFAEYCRLAGVTDAGAPTVPEAVRRARELAESRFAEPLDAEAFARAAGVSEGHLRRLFREHLDGTPVDYLWRVREQEGLRLLRETGLSVSEIAYRCGFRTPYHFSRRIRAAHGQPPREIRRQGWRGVPADRPARIREESQALRIMRADSGWSERLRRLDPLLDREPPRMRALRQAILAGNAWIAIRSQEPLGYVLATPADGFFHYGFVDLLWVAPASRRQGVGRTLLEQAARTCRTDRLFTSTNRSNRPMQALLEKQGYAFAGEVTGLDDGDPEWFYVKSLAP